MIFNPLCLIINYFINRYHLRYKVKHDIVFTGVIKINTREANKTIN